MTDFATACVLSYERPEFLEECLRTLSGYADYPLEVIVHDDGSRNPVVREILQRALVERKVSRLILNPPGHNEGQGVALNRMFQMAKGDPIIKVDQDLVFQPGWLKRSVEIIRANREQFIEAGTDKLIGVLGLFKYPAEPVRYEDMFIKDCGFPGFEWEEHLDFVGSCMVIPRDVWEAFGVFEERSEAFAEDRNFKFKVRDEGEMALALPKGSDLVVNQGFGVGPSTVVIAQGTVATIEKGPVVVNQTPNYIRGIKPGEEAAGR
jgi:GT2 family glycosyltransferase